MVGWARLGLLTVLAGLTALPAPQARGATGPRVGDPCQAVHTYPVTFVPDPAADGGVRAAFDFAGGAAHGILPLPAGDAALAATHAAYVADVQLGTYEQSDPASAPACRLAPTYHFYCPDTDVVDQFCYTWAQPPPPAAIRR